MHKTVSKNRFKTLGKVLAKNDISIDYMIDWTKESDYTDQPRLGNGNYNGIPGWYFTKTNRVDFNNDEKKVIKEIFKSKGFKIIGIDDGEMEFDNDRYFYPKISFILND
tara:strand:+ start:208 stop:534 length:327 start_codon:yes stop_codon:yes gene_type:complete